MKPVATLQKGRVANDAGRERKLHELRALLDESDADAKAGRFADFDSDAAFLADLRKSGGARGQSPKGGSVREAPPRAVPYGPGDVIRKAAAPG